MEHREATERRRQRAAGDLLIRQRDAECRAPEQGTLGLERKSLDLLAHRRLRQVEPLGRSVEAAAISHGNEGAQQLKIQH
jgi:hypothetical protein